MQNVQKSATESSIMSDIRLAGFVNDSITDGPGIRATVFVQGCLHHCPGCHNPQSWPLEGGTLVTAEALFAQIRQNPLLKGVTFSGGEPMLQAEALIPLAVMIRDAGLELAIYSGYTFEQILEQGGTMTQLLALADTLIDGPFILAERSLAIPFRGSRNQRIIDVAASLQAKKAIIQNSPRWGGPKKLFD